MRDCEPMALIAELFDLRLKLVHPKPGFGVGSWLDEKDEEEEHLAPTKLADFIIAVSGAAEAMMRRAYGFDAVEPVAGAFTLGGPALRGYAQRASYLPSPNKPSEPRLLVQAVSYVREMNAGRDLPQHSIDRVRVAREARKGG